MIRSNQFQCRTRPSKTAQEAEKAREAKNVVEKQKASEKHKAEEVILVQLTNCNLWYAKSPARPAAQTLY